MIKENEELGFYCSTAMYLGSYTKRLNYDFQLADEIFKKQKSSTRNNLKRYESEKKIRNCVGKGKSLRKKEWKRIL